MAKIGGRGERPAYTAAKRTTAQSVGFYKAKPPDRYLLTNIESMPEKTIKCLICRTSFDSVGLKSCPAHSFGESFSPAEWDEVEDLAATD